MKDFIENKVTVNHVVSTEVLLNYYVESIKETMKNKVAQEFGEHAINKVSLVQHRSPAKAAEEFTYVCYIFSVEEIQALSSYIEQLEKELAMLRVNNTKPWRL